MVPTRSIPTKWKTYGWQLEDILKMTPESADTILFKKYVAINYLFDYGNSSQCSIKTQGIESQYRILSVMFKGLQ